MVIIRLNIFLFFQLKRAFFFLAGVLSAHENRVTSLSVASNGLGITTCSWDQHVRVWG